MSAIVAMLFAAIYVLMPTVVNVVDGPQTEQKTADLTTNKGNKPKGSELRSTYTADDTDSAAQAAKVLQARLQAAGVPTESVRADDVRVDVGLLPGGRKEDVDRLALAPGVVTFWPVTVIGGAEPTGAAPASPATEPWWPAAVDAAGKPIADAVAPLALTAAPATVGDNGPVRIAITAADASTPVPAELAVAIDGLPRAVAVRQGDTYAVYPLLPADKVGDRASWPPDLAPILASGPLPALQIEKKAETQEEEVAVTQKESKFPDWFKAALPNTPMNLGLDLQGGIELTLQVELDEAVLAQATRDAQYLKDQAGRDGLAFDSVKHDRNAPIIRVQTKSNPSDVEAWFAKKLGTYDLKGSTDAGGGETEYQLQLKDKEQKKVADSATDQVLETLRKRIDATGVKEPSIFKKGGGRIGIQLPGMVDMQSAIDAIGTTAVLEFRLVDEQFDQPALNRMIAAAQKALPPDQYNDDEVLNAWLHQTNRLAEDRTVLWEYEDKGGEHVRKAPLPLEEVMLTGNDIQAANVAWDQNQQPYVALEFKSHGAQIFCQVTTENVGHRFGIILDNEVKSSPNIKDKICGGRASIEMGASMDALDEANTLALVLRTGSLNAPVTIGEVRTVGSTLGQDAIKEGVLGTLIGSVLVFLYMGIWYRLSGLVANAALGLNVLICLAFLALFGATLTLPGICGIALTVGMAVDANIIVYERIREELKLGMNARKAVEAGFEKAFSAIMDANVAHAIAGTVLYSYGTGPIKGFAVTLLVGIISTVITALFVTRTLMDLLTRNSNARLSI